MRFGGSWLVAPLLSLLLAALAISMPYQSTAQQPGGMEAISIDMNPAGNTATSLGDRQECVEALPGDALTVDVTATSIPSGFPMIAYSYLLLFDGPLLAITDQEPLMILASPGSSLLNVSDPPPILDGAFDANVLDTNVSPTAVESGSGVLDRVTIEIATDAAPAIYQLEFEAPAHIAEDGSVYVPATINDARIAVGLSCTSATPIPARTPNPQDTGTPTPPGTTVTPTASATPDSAARSPAASATPGDSPTVTSATPTPDGPSASPISQPDDSSGDSTTVIALTGALLAGIAAAGAAGWLAYRHAVRD